MRRIRWILIATAALALAAPGATAQEAQEARVSIGSGFGGSIYHTYGDILCGLAQAGGNLACDNVETLNFSENITGIVDRAFTFGLMSSVWLDDAYDGVGRRQEDGPLPALRSVLALPATLVTVLARPDANIDTPLDLKGLRVVTAPPRTIIPFGRWLAETDWQAEDLRGFGSMGFENSLIEVCEGRADAVIYIDGHPGQMTKIATDKCPLTLVAMDDAGVTRVVENDPTLMLTEIPGGLYAGHPEPTRTYGTYIVLVTHEDVPEDAVHDLVKSVFADFDGLRASHEALAGWRPEHVKALTFPAPLHPGAERYYREAGLR